MVKVLEILGR